jgi:hypothetical protein
MHRLESFPSSFLVASLFGTLVRRVDSWKQLYLNKWSNKTRHKLSWKQSLRKETFTGSGCTVGDRVCACLSVMSRRRLHSEASNQDVPSSSARRIEERLIKLTIAILCSAWASCWTALTFLNDSMIWLPNCWNKTKILGKESEQFRKYGEWDDQPRKFSAILEEEWLIIKQDKYGVVQQKQYQASGIKCLYY